MHGCVCVASSKVVSRPTVLSSLWMICAQVCLLADIGGSLYIREGTMQGRGCVKLILGNYLPCVYNGSVTWFFKLHGLIYPKNTPVSLAKIKKWQTNSPNCEPVDTSDSQKDSNEILACSIDSGQIIQICKLLPEQPWVSPPFTKSWTEIRFWVLNFKFSKCVTSGCRLEQPSKFDATLRLRQIPHSHDWHLDECGWMLKVMI